MDIFIDKFLSFSTGGKTSKKSGKKHEKDEK